MWQMIFGLTEKLNFFTPQVPTTGSFTSKSSLFCFLKVGGKLQLLQIQNCFGTTN